MVDAEPKLLTMLELVLDANGAEQVERRLERITLLSPDSRDTLGNLLRGVDIFSSDSEAEEGDGSDDEDGTSSGATRLGCDPGSNGELTDEDQDEEQDEDGPVGVVVRNGPKSDGRGYPQQARTRQLARRKPLTVACNNYGQPPPFASEHCPPLPPAPGPGYGPVIASECNCGRGICLVVNEMKAWLVCS
eukprot:SAG11_NODE_6409_length_1319_cov_2.717213_1_plen_190_part_00